MTSAQRLRERLAQPGAIKMPCCYDALSALLIRDANYELSIMSGLAVAATRLGVPDIGLISFTEMRDQVQNICRATPDLSIIADCDSGFGNALNLQRTVVEYAQAGAAAVMIEDETTPKNSAGMVRKEAKEVIGRFEARLKIRAAVDVRAQADVLILARTNARAVEGFEAALERCVDFAEEGADIIYMEGMDGEDELRRMCAAVDKPSMSIVAYKDDTPVFSVSELEEMGFKILYDPLLEFFCAVHAAQQALAALADGSTPLPPRVSVQDVDRIVGLAEHCEREALYGATD